MKALTDISTQEFSNTVSLEETPDYSCTIDDDADDDDNEDEDVDGASEHDGKYDYLDATECSSCCIELYFINQVVD